MADLPTRKPPPEPLKKKKKENNIEVPDKDIHNPEDSYDIEKISPEDVPPEKKRMPPEPPPRPPEQRVRTLR